MATATLNEPVVVGNPVIPVEALAPILYKDVPVLTTALLSAVYGTTQARIRENYRVNRDRFTEGKHLFKVSGEELRALKECVRNSDSSDFVPKTGGELTLWTARGAARHAKMLNTDKAWDVFELLEENYFSRRPSPPATPTGTLTAAQQQEIKELVQAKASVFPDAVKRKVFSQIWMRLQRKFKVPRYEELPVALFGEARDYVITMQLRSVAEPALEGEETKALPPARRRNTLDDYKNMYRELPDSPQHWLRLITETFTATEALGNKLDAIKAEATKPFRSGRTSDVSSYFDASMSPIYDLFSIADEQLRLTYRCVYNALEGCRNTWLLLNKG